jgi:hypothetical protein
MNAEARLDQATAVPRTHGTLSVGLMEALTFSRASVER